MTPSWTDSQESLAWDELETLYRLAPPGNKSAALLQIVFTNSRFKFFAYDEGRLVAAGARIPTW